MTNGAPLLVRAAMKPIPTTAARHDQMDLSSGQAGQVPVPTRRRLRSAGRSRDRRSDGGMDAGEEALVERLGGDTLRQMMR